MPFRGNQESQQSRWNHIAIIRQGRKTNIRLRNRYVMRLFEDSTLFYRPKIPASFMSFSHFLSRIVTLNLTTA